MESNKKNNKSLSFKAGEVIQDCVKPFIKVLVPAEKNRRCANCFKSPQGSEELKHCGACKINHYCSKGCQQADWKFAHSVECKSPLTRRPVTTFGKISSYAASNWNSAVARVLAHFKLHPAEEVKEHEIYDGTTRSFSTLMAHVNSGDDQTLDLMAQEMSACVIHKDSKWGPEYIRKIAGIWKINSYDLMSESGDSKIGEGLFVELSVFDHSCRPTALPVCDGNNEWCCQVRAIADIPPGDQPLISYFTGLMSREERQSHLKKLYNFECRCDLCEEEEKGGPAVSDTDLEELKDFEQNFEVRAWEAMKQGPGKAFESIANLRNRIIRLYSPLCHPYDEQPTLVAWNVLSFLLGNYVMRLQSPAYARSQVWKLARDTLKRLRMTYGVEHTEYKTCMAGLNQLGITAADAESAE